LFSLSEIPLPFIAPIVMSHILVLAVFAAYRPVGTLQNPFLAKLINLSTD
jgi:hypothetical protein